jgi:hypothetical protein
LAESPFCALSSGIGAEQWFGREGPTQAGKNDGIGWAFPHHFQTTRAFCRNRRTID